MRDRVQTPLDAALDRQSRAWLAGGRPTIDELTGGSPLRHDAEAQLDLIYNEVVLREELGERPAAAEYVARYPNLRRDLELHFEVHRAMADDALAVTPRLDGTTLADDDATPAVALPQLPDY